MNKYENAMKLMEEYCGNKKYGEWQYKVDFAKKEVK